MGGSKCLERRGRGDPASRVVDLSVWEGFRESRRCSRDTYPDSYITEYILIYEEYFRGMFAADQARKKALVKHGFRLPSALDNRPLKDDEFWSKVRYWFWV